VKILDTLNRPLRDWRIEEVVPLAEILEMIQAEWLLEPLIPTYRGGWRVGIDIETEQEKLGSSPR
jgi:hypothetical protein